MSLCDNDQGWAEQTGHLLATQELERHFFFSDTLNVINVKVCMMVLFIELYLFIPPSLALTIFQGHISVKQFLQGILYYLIKLKLWKFVLKVCQVGHK